MEGVIPRKKIRELVAKYDECERQDEAVRKDFAIQNAYACNDIEKARALRAERYPLAGGSGATLLELQKVMMSPLPEDQRHVNSSAVLYNMKLRIQLLNLARRV